MDLALWKEIEPSGKILPAEFQDPERMGARLVKGVGQTRLETGQMMRMTQSADGRKTYHPNGDANAIGIGHGTYSLHFFGMDHAASKIDGEIIAAPADDGQAVDFDFAVSDPNHLFELYLKLERIHFDFEPYRWTGIGAYPHWHLGRKPNPGFHIDLRSLDHPNVMGRWMRDAAGTYIPLTWKNWRKEFGLNVHVAASGS